MVRVELHDAADAVTKIDRGLALAEGEDQDNARLLIESTSFDARQEAEAVMRRWAGEPVEMDGRSHFEVWGPLGRSVSVELRSTSAANDR